ncbi:hypothetical protein ACFL6C_06380 [Myxococcota bacterium]
MRIVAKWELPPEIRARVGSNVGRQRAMSAEGHLLLILHKVPDPSKPEREGALFWRHPDGSWSYSGRGRGLPMLREHVQEFADAIDKLEAQYAEAQDPAHYFRLLERIGPLNRTVKNLFTTLQAAREKVPNETDIMNVRDRAYEVSRAADILHMDAKNGLDYEIATQVEAQGRAAHEMTRASHRLNVIAAMFFPLTAIGAMFGTTLTSGLEDAPSWLFWAILAAGIVVGFAVRGQVLRTKQGAK